MSDKNEFKEPGFYWARLSYWELSGPVRKTEWMPVIVRVPGYRSPDDTVACFFGFSPLLSSSDDIEWGARIYPPGEEAGA